MITQLSLQEQVDLIQKKEVKVEELFQEYLTNIDKLNPQLNAIVSLRAVSYTHLTLPTIYSV